MRYITADLHNKLGTLVESLASKTLNTLCNKTIVMLTEPQTRLKGSTMVESEFDGTLCLVILAIQTHNAFSTHHTKRLNASNISALKAYSSHMCTE